MFTRAQNCDCARDFLCRCITIRPPRCNPALFPPKIPVFPRFSAFSRDFAAKTAPHTVPRSNAALRKSTIHYNNGCDHVHPRAKQRLCPQFPMLLRCHPAARGAIPPQSRLIPAENSGFADIFGFFARFRRKNTPRAVPPAPERSATQNQRLFDRARLNAERRPRPQFPIFPHRYPPTAAQFRPNPA